MNPESRVLPAEPVPDLAAYRDGGGARALDAARRVAPDALIGELTASGLRGRGGAGFPTGVKWQTVAGYGSAAVPTTVVVNAAEGEPGTFKDRAILEADPYRVLEGALIAARAVGADRVRIAMKAGARPTIARVQRAIEEIDADGWCDGIGIELVRGPSEYLFGEETALLEVLAGRPPFPRLQPPFRAGADTIGDVPDTPAGTVMADEDSGTPAPPTLVNNVETLANVPGIIERGAAWFRSVGTERSPGTVTVTVSGSVRRAGVAEVPMGTRLVDVLDQVGQGPRPDRTLVAALPGSTGSPIPAARFDVPLTYEDFEAIGGSLGSAGFIVLDDEDDLVAAVASVSRFLAVESCGQCTPCKQDGLALADLLEALRRSDAPDDAEERLVALAERVTESSRCYLATQHQKVVEGLLACAPGAVAAHADGRAAPATPVWIAPMLAIAGDAAVLDEAQLTKQPDWTQDETDSGQSPADRIDRVR